MNATPLDTRVERLEAEVQALKTRSSIEEVHRANVEKRLYGIEDTLKWLVRLVIGAMLMAIVGFLVGGGFQI